MQNTDQYHLYLGLYHNRPAVAGSLFYDGTAGLYCITTARHMRRKGLATAYLKEVLTEAKTGRYVYFACYKFRKASL